MMPVLVPYMTMKNQNTIGTVAQIGFLHAYSVFLVLY